MIYSFFNELPVFVSEHIVFSWFSNLSFLREEEEKMGGSTQFDCIIFISETLEKRVF